MKIANITQRTGLRINSSTVGESIESQVDRAMNNKEPLDNTAGEPIYTERKNGVLPQYNIRTDRWDIAVEAMTAVSGSFAAKRMDALKQREQEDGVIDLNAGQNDGKAEPTDGTK